VEAARRGPRGTAGGGRGTRGRSRAGRTSPRGRSGGGRCQGRGPPEGKAIARLRPRQRSRRRRAWWPAVTGGAGASPSPFLPYNVLLNFFLFISLPRFGEKHRQRRP
jgi:hypothetical protein